MAVSDRLQRRTVLLLAAASLACAPAGREGESIHIADESAIIVWDEAAKTQHFIRRADFRTQAKDFGFLVPTPSVPTLAEADNAAFGFLARLTAPETVWRLDIDIGDAMRPAAMKAEAPKSEEVRIIEEKKVAGYDAAVLEASNADALDGWLKKHGYHSSPELVEWFKPYIAQHWKITAFKVSRDIEGDRAKASAVRMSFATERPYFPYREPKPAANTSDHYRSLRVFFLGNLRVDGKIGAAAVWPGSTVWSGDIESSDRRKLFEHLKLAPRNPEAKLRLTEFIDSSSPRPGSDDLFFSPADTQSQVRRPPIVYNISPVTALFLLAVAGGLAAIAFLILRGLWRAIRRLAGKAR